MRNHNNTAYPATEFDDMESAKNWIESYCIDSPPAGTVERIYRDGIPAFDSQDELDDYIYNPATIRTYKNTATGELVEIGADYCTYVSDCEDCFPLDRESAEHLVSGEARGWESVEDVSH